LATVILVPVVLISMLLVVQFGLVYYARQVVAGATQDGAAAGARRGSSGDAGAALAGQLIASSAGHLLTSHSSAASSDARTVTVVSTGHVVKVLPFFPTITVHATATSTIEVFIPQGNGP
jgi:Flp pilus assembly protein TadG